VKKKFFEMAVVELLEYKIIIVCIYRSPDGILIFFKKVGPNWVGFS
jgi:hypothetical protein